jgi:uncharacterized membrane protein
VTTALRHLAIAAALAAGLAAAPAWADLKLCNRMSYVVDAAIAVDADGATATRGWFRLDPAQCRIVLQGDLPAGRLLLHVRTPAFYGVPPTQAGRDRLCIADDDFTIAAARQCRAGHTLAPFTEIKPSPGDDGSLTAYLAEDSEYDDEQARRAGIQRLLVIGGYDAAPIDGVDGPKTRAALAAFLTAQGLGPEAADAPAFFATMIKAVQAPAARGLTWCNDTPYKVMAAIGIDDGRTITTRGWYGVEAGNCLHPDIPGQPKQIYSFAEAVDGSGRAVTVGTRPLNWGGARLLCTREAKFEITEHSDCAARGLASTGFAATDATAGNGKTLRFALPR